MGDAADTRGWIGRHVTVAAAGVSLAPGPAGAASIGGDGGGLLWPVLAGGLALGLVMAVVALVRLRARLGRYREMLAAEVDALRAADRRARTDPVTGLLGRRGLSAAFERHRQRLDERDFVITVLMFEVDRLDQIRSADGPEGVDAMLGRLARVLPAVLRDEDDAGRIDGGRFALILSAPRYTRASDGLARRLQEAVAAAPDLSCLGEPMTLSIGIAQTAATMARFEHLLVEAELALDAAGAEGAGRVVPFGPPIAGARARRSAALHTLAEAFGGDGPPVLYQPIAALDDLRVLALAAVPQLEGPQGTRVDAATLAHAAAEPHLALRLARHIQARAIAGLGHLRRQGLDRVQLALDVAELQLADAGFVEALLDQLIVEGLSARDLWLVIPEGAFLSRRLPAVLETLERLHEAGAVCGIGGFGTGYAPLVQLRRAPLTWLQLDPALVGEIVADEAAREIAAAARTMAAAIGTRVCAGGVETAALAAAAAELGFDCGQGTHICPPVPLAEIQDILRTGLAA